MLNNVLQKREFVNGIENTTLEMVILNSIKMLNEKIDSLNNKEEKIFDENLYFEQFTSNYPAVKIIKSLLKKGKLKSAMIKPFCKKKEFIPFFLNILKNTGSLT